MPSGGARTIRFRLTLVLSILLLPVVAYMVLLGWSYARQQTLARTILVLGPIFVWLVALAVVCFSADLLIALPVRRLTRVAQAHSQGDLSVNPSLSGPAELRNLA